MGAQSRTITVPKMTKLEEEIFLSLHSIHHIFKAYPKKEREEYQAKVAAGVAKKYIEKAFEAGYKRMGWEEGITWGNDPEAFEQPNKEKWLKENIE